MSAFQLNESTNHYHVARPVTSDEIIKQAKIVLRVLINKPGTHVFTSPEIVKNFLQFALAPEQREVFAVLFLNNRHHLLEYEPLFFGTIDGCSVHPREVVKRALHHNAAAVILAHNHPSGVADPSTADQQITKRLTDALSLVDIRVLDHLVIGSDEITSFAERGLLP